MKRVYLIVWTNKEYVERIGYIIHNEDHYLGIHREVDHKNWTVTELRTGLKCNNFDLPTLDKAKEWASSPDTAKWLTEFMSKEDNPRFNQKRYFAEMREKMRKAYEETNANTELYWKLFPEEWQG